MDEGYCRCVHPPIGGCQDDTCLSAADVRVGGQSRRSRFGRESACPPISDMSGGRQIRRDVPCVDGSELARTFFTPPGWSVQPCVRPVCAAHMTAYPVSIPDVVSNT